MTDRKMIALTAASAAVGIINPIGIAAFLGLQAYFWTDLYLKEREQQENEPRSEFYFDADRNK